MVPDRRRRLRRDRIHRWPSGRLHRGEGAWGQLTDELLHVHFDRGALVTNDGHVAGAVNILKWTLHGHVRTFHKGEFDQAVHWITT
ncbi:STAS/SEC14 domain-containing protein [Ilumatobacter sp.]|uniref:STAS/SEC14 domain-containing protein n=1 Tax=Ilumatobacter sp. TaxID=1967498 RepID=UPI003752C103